MSSTTVDSSEHIHAFGEWKVETTASCTAAGVEIRECECGEKETREGDAATGHTAVSIRAVCDKTDTMKYDVLSAEDFTVTATCGCGATYVVTEGITIENGTLAIGENTVTVKVGELSADVIVNADEFNKVVNGAIVDDTYVNSSNKTTNYAESSDLCIYNTGTYRAFFRFNFSKVLNSEYYADFGEEAIVKFTFTVTNGVDLAELPVTFKSYLTSEVRSSVDFSELTWNNYSNPYTLGWGSDTDSNNTVSLLVKEPVGNRAIYTDGKLVITVTLRELEGCIDAKGNAIFVLLTAQKDVKPCVASMENEEFDIPSVSVIFSEKHVHAYIEEVVDNKYLASTHCGETAKYYKSCSCGEASADTFAYGEIIEHSYGEFVKTQDPTCTVEGVNTKTCSNCGDTQTEAIPVIPHSYTAVVTEPTCTEDGYTTYTCSCGDTYTADEVTAKGHSYGDWQYDKSYHWVACSCGEIANKGVHTGGTATEDERAVCEICSQPYGEKASHVHSYNAVVTEPTCTEKGYTTYTCSCGDIYVANEIVAKGHSYGEWESFSPAGCEVDEVLIRYCGCGAYETGVGMAAFGHDMKTKYDENSHWTECAHNCGKSTEHVAHSGGTATETERAVCDGCGQSYGELKPAEKKEYTVAGAIVEDTYVGSNNSNAKKTDNSTKDSIGTYSKYYRAYFKFNFSNIIHSEDFEANKENGKVRFVFSVSNGDVGADSAFTFGGFIPGTGITDVDFSEVYWNNLVAGATYNSLNWGNAENLLNAQVPGDNVEYANKTITITFSYKDIASFIDPTTGYAVFTLRIAETSGISIASMENAQYAAPAVNFIYEK